MRCSQVIQADVTHPRSVLPQQSMITKQLCSTPRLHRACAPQQRTLYLCSSQNVVRTSGCSAGTENTESSSIGRRAVFSLAAAQILFSQIPQAEARQYVDMSTAEAEAARIASSPENLIPGTIGQVRTVLTNCLVPFQLTKTNFSDFSNFPFKACECIASDSLTVSERKVQASHATNSLSSL